VLRYNQKEGRKSLVEGSDELLFTARELPRKKFITGVDKTLNPCYNKIKVREARQKEN
jgi:hypothetical protein